MLPAALPEKPAYGKTDAGEYQRARKDRRFQLERVRYASGGLAVHAYVYRPSEVHGRKLPAGVFNRGSYTLGDIGAELLRMLHRLASEGFVVVVPMYRGSDGAPGRDEMGGADVEDVMNVVPLSRALGFVDVDNLFLYGESRGGMMTYQALRQRFPARAAATFGAFTDLEQMLDASPPMRKAADSIWPDYAERREHHAETRSAVRWAEALEVPLLLMHEGADGSVSPTHSLALAGKLQALGREYELHVFAGDGHRLDAHRVERDRAAAAWFRQYLKAP